MTPLPPPGTSEAAPYCGPLAPPGDLLAAWNTDPVLLGALALAGLGALWLGRHAGPDSGRDRAAAIAFCGLILAFVSPLCAATVALFAARAGHHLVLLCIVAPALAIALPWRVLPASAGFAVTALALVMWHVPAVYDAAWASVAVYWLLQAALVLPAWIFWSVVLAPGARADTLLGHAVLVGGLAGVMGLIGAVLTFAPRAFYPQHLTGADLYGISLLADQQLAGLIMWVPGFVPLAAVAFWMLRRGWSRGFAA